MRVGIIAYAMERPAPPSSVSYTIELCSAILRASKDVQITLLMTSAKGVDRLPPGVRIHVLPGCALLPGLMTIGNLAVAAAVRALHLDIVHDPTGVTPFLLRSLYRKAQTLATVHDLVSYIYPQTHTPLTNFLQKVWLPWGLKLATAVVTVSQHSKTDLCHYLGLNREKIAVVPCGVNARFSPIAEEGERERLAARYGIHRPYILYLGDVQARKNVTGLLQAFARIHETLPARVLVIAGARTWKYEAIYSMVDELNLAKDVLFTGYVADVDAPALYRQADLFVYPSLYEGFGRPPLEAMACGTPVVTSNASSLPEVVGDAAILVDPHDVDAIAGGMGRGLEDSALRAKLRTRGLTQASRFTWERAARDTITVYEHLLNHC
jgi:glycosyltransferase involved in cell wall biosynthesis